MRTSRKILVLLSVAGVSAIGGFIGGAVTAADAVDKLQTTTSMTDGKGIAYSGGENAEALARAASRGITTYEDDSKVGGGGAPEKTLIDNDVLRVSLVAFPKGFERAGGMKRRNDQLLVYVDKGAYSLKTSAGVPNATPIPNRVAPGSAIFHRRESIISATHIDEDYRVLFIEMKKK